jgi:hypothetical protein
MNTENTEMYWKKQKHKQQNIARPTKEWLREKKKQNVLCLIVVMTNQTAQLKRTATSKHLNEF